MLFFPHINVKMPTVVGILTFMGRKNFTLIRVEHEKSFITSGPVCIYVPKMVLQSEKKLIYLYTLYFKGLPMEYGDAFSRKVLISADPRSLCLILDQQNI